MKNLNIVLTLLLCCMLWSPAAAGAETAAGIIDKTAKKISGSASITASYHLTSPGEGSVSGTLTLAGDNFRMTSPRLITWYDGTTQWTYLVSENEVNVSEPTADELQQVNPFVIINTLRNTYTPSLQKSSNGEKCISLKAKNSKSDIVSALLTINAATSLPKSITLNMSDNRKITISLSNVRTGKKLPVTAFRFDPKKYPGAEIIDLR